MVPQTVLSVFVKQEQKEVCAPFAIGIQFLTNVFT